MIAVFSYFVSCFVRCYVFRYLGMYVFSLFVRCLCHYFCILLWHYVVMSVFRSSDIAFVRSSFISIVLLNVLYLFLYTFRSVCIQFAMSFVMSLGLYVSSSCVSFVRYVFPPPMSCRYFGM